VKKWDFKLRLKTVSDIARRCGGRQFYAAGSAWLKPRSPNFVLVVRLIYLAVSVDLKRRRLPEQADCPLSTRYCGARPMWIWCISKENLYLMLLATGNQWCCFIAGVTRSRRWRSSTRQAAAFFKLVMVQLLYVVVQLAERYNSLDAKGWILRWAVLWHLCQLVVWSVSVGEDGRSSSLLPLWDAAT